MKKRVVGLFAALLFAFSGLIVRISRLISDESLQTAEAQSSVTVTVAQVRGTIYDCNLKRLTNASTEYRASIISTTEAMASLSEALSEEEWMSLSESLQSGKPVVQTFANAMAPVTGVSLFTVPVRYGKTQLAAHVIGYVGDDGAQGVSGIEKALDDVLAETGGSVTVTYQTDGNGRVLAGGETNVENTLYRAASGVALTLDSGIQRLVEDQADLVGKGAVVVMEPATGAMVAMASFPSFDPTDLESYLTAEESPLFNRAIAAYNCGSVFKIVSAAAALEAGVPLTQSFNCAGSIPVGANVIKCHHVLGHGTLTLTDAFVKSCNPYFIQLIQLAGGSSLYRMATGLGFGRALSLASGYSTATAVFPTEEELLQPTALANVSFGQGALSATPVHIAQATAAVVNGGVVYQPHLVLGTVDVNGNLTSEEQEAPMRLFSQKTAQTLYEMMISAVEEGTGASASPSVGGAGGKTGTAETGWELEDGSTMVQSWFTGFYPAEDPRYVITVICEDAGSTDKTAAPVFREICDGLARMGYTGA